MMLHLFGFPCIKVGNKSLQGLPTKAYIAVALLSTKYGKTARRSTLASYLWENRNTDLANLNLRQLLARIRRFEKQNSTEIIQTDYNELTLESSISCDLCKFLSIDKLTKSDELIDYIASFGKEFLKGLEDNVGEDLNKWILIQRQNYSNKFLQVVLDGALHIGGNEGIKALEYLLSIHPYNEKVLQSLILLLSRNGEYKKTQWHFEWFAQKLKEDLHITPKASTIKLVARLFPETIPYLQNEYSFLSATVSHNLLPSKDGNFNLKKITNSNGNPIPRLLILPPNSISNKSQISDHSLASSIVEDMTLALCQMHNFVVLAPHTAKQFVKLEHEQIQPNFDVDYIISTHLRPNNIHSNVKEKNLAIKLTSVSSGEIVMVEEMPFLQTKFNKKIYETVQSLVKRIGLKIDRYTLSSFRNTGSANAYTFYLIGKERLGIGDLPNVRAARKAFKHALKLSPEFYLAQQMIARTYHLEWFLLGRQEKDLLLEAKNRATRLIEIDPMASGGHWELGVAQLYLGDIDGALEHTSVAADFSPHHADILAHRADVLCHHGQHKNALKQIKIALKFNPLPPDNYYWMQGCSKFFTGKYQEALRSISQAEAVSPISFRFLAACHAMLGNKKEARKYKNRHLHEYPDFRVKIWLDMFPAKERYDADHYVDALLLAGFT